MIILFWLFFSPCRQLWWWSSPRRGGGWGGWWVGSWRHSRQGTWSRSVPPLCWITSMFYLSDCCALEGKAAVSAYKKALDVAKAMDADQSVTVPKILNNTNTDTFLVPNNLIPIPILFFWYQSFLIPTPRLFQYQFLPILVSRIFSGTKFFRYVFWYHQNYEKFPVPALIRYQYPS